MGALRRAWCWLVGHKVFRGGWGSPYIRAIIEQSGGETQVDCRRCRRRVRVRYSSVDAYAVRCEVIGRG